MVSFSLTKKQFIPIPSYQLSSNHIWLLKLSWYRAVSDTCAANVPRIYSAGLPFIKRAHACIPFPLAMLILSMHSLNALTCSGVSSDSSIVARRALRERSISFLVNRKQITLTQRGENLLRPIALVIRSFMRCLLTASGGDFKLAYNTRGEDLCDYFAIEISKGRFT